MNSAVYQGVVHHTRFLPVRHAFTYRLFHLYLDLAELDDVFRGRWLWSTRRFALARFRRDDHLGDPSEPLDISVRNLVEEETGTRPGGPIRLLTHLRYFGYVMNPVSFYYCFAPSGESVDFVVAEINNTPWGERFCYVVDRRRDASESTEHRFDKRFHVSPFMPMDMEYRWKFNVPESSLSVAMENHRHGRRVFSARLDLERRPISTFRLASVLVTFPLMTVRVISGIYWQAFRLWLKKVPYYAHPRHGRSMETVR